MKTDDFRFDFHKISFPGIAYASKNINSAMVIWKQLYQNSCSFWLLHTHLTKITNAAELGEDWSVFGTKLKPAGSESNEALEINALQEFNPYALFTQKL